MKPILILNDVHLGTQRSAGTTPQTAAQLKEFLFESFSKVIFEHLDKDLLLNGDTFDKFTEEDSTIERTFSILYTWLSQSGNTLHLIPGNHDFSAKANKLSSFHLLANILEAVGKNKVIVYGSQFSPVVGHENVFTIPHCLNQDLFEVEFERALAEDIKPGSKLFLHANVDSPFAAQADHSLNLSEEYARRLTDHGYQIIVAHEHQWRCVNVAANSLTTSGRWDPEMDIIITGNQFPSSVSDCLAHGLAQKDGCKYAHVLEDGKLSRFKTWDNEGNFIRVQWDNLKSVEDERFVRVEGEVTPALADEVLTTIQKFRQKSGALVITNAVKIEGVNNLDEDAAISLESIKRFDVKLEFLKLFTDKEREVLESVLGEA